MTICRGSGLVLWYILQKTILSYDNSESIFAKLQSQMPLFTHGTLDCCFSENLWMIAAISYQFFFLHVFILLLWPRFFLIFSFAFNNHLTDLAKFGLVLLHVVASPLIYYTSWWTCSCKMARLGWHGLIHNYYCWQWNKLIPLWPLKQ